jgi:hypothetical protein
MYEARYAGHEKHTMIESGLSLRRRAHQFASVSVCQMNIRMPADEGVGN